MQGRENSSMPAFADGSNAWDRAVWYYGVLMSRFHPFWQMILVGALICVPAGMMLLQRMSSPSGIAVDEKTARYLVTGLVTEGALPVADARVRFKGRSEVAFTDREGRFR